MERKSNKILKNFVVSKR